MVCCTCSNRGLCVNCVCVKAGRPCFDCQPNSTGRCGNRRLVETVDAVDPQSVPDHMAAGLPFCVSLPHFCDMQDRAFVWGVLDGPTCVSQICVCYEAAVHWKPNLFRVIPNGLSGERFVRELSRLFNSFANVSALEYIALKAAHLLPLLILQKPSKKLKAKVISSHVDRRLTLWSEGHFLDLLQECKDIQ